MADSRLNRDALLECLRHVVRMQDTRRMYQLASGRERERDLRILEKIVSQQLEELVAAGLMNEGLFDKPAKENPK
jgi:hypothetical protein